MPQLEPYRAAVLRELLVVSAVVTALATFASAFTAAEYVASAVGAVFLAATWWCVWRHDDATVERFGLSLGGHVLSKGRVGISATVADFARQLLLACVVAAIIYVPFTLGWKLFWAPHRRFVSPWTWMTFGNAVAGQLFVIALPEEAFYRGYLQTRCDDFFPSKRRFFGADIGLGLPVSSAVFAVGHIMTVHQPARLAVFFPSLVFGWMRARTGGIGAGILFHAMCNVLSETLGRGYGVY